MKKTLQTAQIGKITRGKKNVHFDIQRAQSWRKIKQRLATKVGLHNLTPNTLPIHINKQHLKSRNLEDCLACSFFNK